MRIEGSGNKVCELNGGNGTEMTGNRNAERHSHTSLIVSTGDIMVCLLIHRQCTMYIIMPFLMLLPICAKNPRNSKTEIWSLSVLYLNTLKITYTNEQEL